MGLNNFKASNGWLDWWKKRYNIYKIKICGQSADVSGETVESWKERLLEILHGYSAENIWNLDETGWFWHALPEHGFGEKGSLCKGGRKAKQRFTITLVANAAGGKKCAIVIWKAERPRCFKGVDMSKLPVQYFSQSNAWMTGEILDRVLTKLNHCLSSCLHSIVLLMDNAGCHPHDWIFQYTNNFLTSKYDLADSGSGAGYNPKFQNPLSETSAAICAFKDWWNQWLCFTDC